MNTHPSPHDAPDQPARAAGRSPRLGRFRRATLAAAVLAGAGGLMLAASGIAFASVDQTSPQWAELGSLASTANQANQVTAVYTIKNVAEPGTELLEDNGGNMNNGATIDVWSQVPMADYQDPMRTGPYGPITSANELWEYVPDNSGNGGSIVDGYGELINRYSGLCLDDDGSPNQEADGATITQYGCNGAAAEQWTAKKIGSSYQVQAEVDNGGGALGVGNGSTCSVQGDGDSVYVRTNGLSGNSCDEWDVQQASYNFATNPISVTHYAQSDSSSYGCLTSDTLRRNENSSVYSDWDYDNLSDPEVTPELAEPTPVPADIPVNGVSYLGTPPNPYTGQVMLYCDPQTTTP